MTKQVRLEEAQALPYAVSTVIPPQAGVQYWAVVATSEQEAIDRVAATFWEPLREQTRQELKAQPLCSTL